MALTYSVGDIHGCLDKLESLVEACLAHAGGAATRFVFLGDYIDRGPDSAGVLRFMLRLQSEFQERLIALKGNHEAMALESASGRASSIMWRHNGGAATLESYGVNRAAELPSVHLDWLRSLRSNYDDGLRFFVHAGIDPDKPLAGQDEVDLLWIREPFLTDRRDHGRLIVHGHTPVATGRPELCGNRLNLDTAAVFGGPLTAAVFNELETEPFAFLQAK
jgi:diadenosine tetraphosphatase ApaH/serine/threonine PP2A family protein phosphatase